MNDNLLPTQKTLQTNVSKVNDQTDVIIKLSDKEFKTVINLLTSLRTEVDTVKALTMASCSGGSGGISANAVIALTNQIALFQNDVLKMNSQVDALSRQVAQNTSTQTSLVSQVNQFQNVNIGLVNQITDFQHQLNKVSQF